jgi:hypothetical protein
MTDPEDLRPESTEEAAEIVQQDPALRTATETPEDDDVLTKDESVPEPTD